MTDLPIVTGHSPAMRRYWRRSALFTALYVVFILLAGRQLDLLPTSSVWRWPLALAPALALLGVFWAIGRLWVEEADEYVRMLLVRQGLVATGFALSVATLWGFAADAGLVPTAPLYWAAILWFMGLGVGGIANLVLERGGSR